MSEDLTYEIYWTKDSSDDEDLPLVQVPGVNDVGNKRPSVKMRARRTKEIKAVVPPKSPVIVEDLSPNKRKPLKSINKSNDDAETVEFSKENNMNSRQRPALKDLRPEDKKRVANLIRELARIGEEKENAVEQLHLERFSFEERTQKLQDQYDSILKEREDLQNQYMDCQKMLANYQTQIAGQQERMSQTLSELVATPKRNGVSERMASLPLPEPSDTKARRRQENIQYSSPGRRRSQPMSGHPGDRVNMSRPADAGLGLYPAENGVTRFQHEFRDDFKPALASTDRSYDADYRSQDFDFQPRLEEKDLYSENQYSVRSELNGNNTSRPYQRDYRDHYHPTLPSPRDWKKIDDLTPPDTYESRTPGGDFRPLSPVASEQESETSEEYKRSSEIINESYNRAKKELHRINYKAQLAAEIQNLPLDCHRSSNNTHAGSLPVNGMSSYAAYEGGNSHPVIPAYPGANSHHRVIPPQGPITPTDSERMMDGKQKAAALLSPELRKQQLLIQREQLRLEQLRLRQKLKDQESQLHRKQEELKQQRELHEDRLRYFELHGKFPPYFSEFTPKTPTYKEKYSPNSSQDSRDDIVSTNYPPLDLQQQQQQQQQQHETPLRRLDLDEEDIINSINAHESIYGKSREEENSYRDLDISQLSSASRHRHGDTSFERKREYISPGQYSNNGNDSTVGRGEGSVQTPRYELDTKHRTDIGTSPLYTDRSVGTSPYRSPNQHISPLADTRYVTESHTTSVDRHEPGSSVLPPRHQYNLPGDMNGYRSMPARTHTVNGYTTTLTDIVDTIERTSIGHDKARQHTTKTPELFSSSGLGDSSYSDQENNLIEDVFFLK